MPSTLQNKQSSRYLGPILGPLGAAVLLGSLYLFSLVLFSQPFGYTQFLAIPFTVGFISAFATSYYRAQSLSSAAFHGILANFATWLIAFAAGTDAAISLSLSFPLVAILGCIGGLIGHSTSRVFTRNLTKSITLGLACLATPLLLVLEFSTEANPSLERIVSTIEIRSSPDLIWKQLISSSNLQVEDSSPEDSILPEPISIQTNGSGVGAQRTSTLTTGHRYERIVEWNPGHLLRFDIVDQSLPIRDWSPYPETRDTIFRGFAQARAGQFRLIPVSPEVTRLESTTWYYHNRWPTAYWTSISDRLIDHLQDAFAERIKIASEEEFESRSKTKQIALH